MSKNYKICVRVGKDKRNAKYYTKMKQNIPYKIQISKIV
jgi:hypothetical protein